MTLFKLKTSLVIFIFFWGANLLFGQAGSVDLSFASHHDGLTIGMSGKVNSFAVQPDDKIIAAGSLFFYNSEEIYDIIRFHPDGTKDSTFNTQVGVNREIKKVRDHRYLLTRAASSRGLENV